MEKKTITEIGLAMDEIHDKAKCEKREFTPEEQLQYNELQREFVRAQGELEAEAAKAQIEAAKREVKRDAAKNLREVLKECKDSKNKREIVLGTVSGSGVQASGAVDLTIEDLIPTLNEGLGLPASLNLVSGVTGNVVYPVSLDDAEIDEINEDATLSETDLNFGKIEVSPKRTGIAISISNMAIDNASFDLLSFVQDKITLATKKYLAKKLFSQANWSGNKGPFAGITAAGAISTSKTPYANILKAVAAFTSKGFDVTGVCLVMDADTEALLKATPKDGTNNGFIIENGKCAGYDYVVTHYINTVLGGDGKTDSGNTDTTKMYDTTAKYIGIGYFNYFAVQQHGAVRLKIDGDSKSVALNDQTAVVLNTEWSFTDLSTKLNGSTAGTTQAFAVYTIA